MQASVRAVETRNVPTAGAAPATPRPSDPVTPPRRLSARTIELVGLALAIGFVTAVALGRDLSNDEFWQLAAGQWMIAHHAIMGTDPFSYTESHRRWVTDEWGSEIALAALVPGRRGHGLQRLRRRAGRSLPAVHRRLRPRPRGAGRTGGCHRHAVGRRHRRGRGRRPGPRLLSRLAPARAARADEGTDEPALAAVAPGALRGVGQHPRIDPHRAPRARPGARMVAGAGPLGRPRRRCAPVAARRPAGPGAAGQRGCLVHHSLRAGLAGLRHRGGGQLADRTVHRRVELPELPLVHGAPGLSAYRWPSSSPASAAGGSRCSRARWRRSSSSRRCGPSAWWST